MKRNSLVSLGSILVILVAGSLYLGFGVAGVDWFRREIHVTLSVPESGGLLPRSKVLLSGMEVGRVTTVRHVGAGVRVEFQVDAKTLIPVSSPARIEELSALGEPYLDFRPTSGDGPYLRDGQTVRADKISTPLSIPEVAKTVTALLRQVDPAALAAIVDTFTRALAGTEQLVPQLSHATDLLAATLMSRTDVIRRLLTALQDHATDMSWAGTALTDAAGPWAEFGPRVSDVAEAIARVIRVGDVPADYLVDTPDTIGLVPLLEQLTVRLHELGPAVAPFIPLFQPLATAGTAAASRLDLGALITQALHATSPDGTLRLQITVK
ncbi:MCE family protein [Nocardia yunnanensis]|uniref:MCE family protein n=1 Tax=Nocardia yunnanensis TaxID=2382165 RepID=A0A386ZC01_9NOCA|nr:MlaD family protein [Nocardia yunnanensis]AYF74827.1 MCE family protein [Nocardia yunnanensis]